MDFIIHREQYSAELFRNMELKTRDRYLQERFREFYLGTMYRIDSLIGLRKKNGKWLSNCVPLSAVRPYLVDIQLRQPFTDAQGLSLSIIRADTSRQLYLLLQSFVKSSKGRALFRHLQEDTQAHLTRCTDLYERLLGLQ